MLANYHFLIRDYSSACEELENYLSKNPNDIKAKKKLIVCYTQTNELEKAFNLFYELVITDIEAIINTNPEVEDCPCPELVEKLEKQNPQNYDQYYFLLELGILWLYCCKETSLRYFEKALLLNYKDERLSVVIEKIKSRITTKIKGE